MRSNLHSFDILICHGFFQDLPVCLARVLARIKHVGQDFGRVKHEELSVKHPLHLAFAGMVPLVMQCAGCSEGEFPGDYDGLRLFCLQRDVLLYYQEAFFSY